MALPSEQIMDLLDWLAAEAAERAAEIAAKRVTAELQAHSPYLTVPEAANYLRCSRQRLYDLTSARVLPVFKDGRKSYFRREDLDAYLAEGRET